MKGLSSIMTVIFACCIPISDLKQWLICHTTDDGADKLGLDKVEYFFEPYPTINTNLNSRKRWKRSNTTLPNSSPSHTEAADLSLDGTDVDHPCRRLPQCSVMLKQRPLVDSNNKTSASDGNPKLTILSPKSVYTSKGTVSSASSADSGYG